MACVLAEQSAQLVCCGTVWEAVGVVDCTVVRCCGICTYFSVRITVATGSLSLAHEHLEHVDPTEQWQHGSICAGGVRLLVRDSWWAASVLNTSGFPRGWGLRVIRGSVGRLVLCPKHTTSVVDSSSEDSECWELNLFEWASA